MAEKTWTCPQCGYINPEWAAECGSCDRCSDCGERLPVHPDPRVTYDLRKPHRDRHAVADHV